MHIRRRVLVKVEPAADKTADNATVRTGLVNGEKVANDVYYFLPPKRVCSYCGRNGL